MSAAPAAVRAAGGVVHVPAAAMRALLARVYGKAGCSAAEASRVAERLVGANLRGHDSHGVIRTPRYLEWIQIGRVRPDQTVTVVSETEALAVVDGNFGFGQTVGEQAVDIGVEKARRHGVAVTALRNSGHLGRIGDWAERAAAAGMASIHMVNVRGSLLVAPFGGVDRRGSTSPFCCGIPVPGGEPIVHDFATSLVAEGKALVALRGGKPLPDGAVIRPDGTLTSDPGPVYGDLSGVAYPDPSRGPGALTGFGLHKGSGLNFFMEMFAGALTGSGTAAVAGESARRPFCNGMLSIYLALESFHSGDWFASEVRGYVEFYKSARPSTPGGEVLIPGEQEARTMRERLRTGLPLAEPTWNDLLAASRRVGLSEAEIDAALG